jgi:hypothetical protein
MKNKTTQGLGNENVLSFPKHDSLKHWKLKSNISSTWYVNTIYVNKSESLSSSFSHLSGDKWFPTKVHVQTTWNFRLYLNCTSISLTRPESLALDHGNGLVQRLTRERVYSPALKCNEGLWKSQGTSYQTRVTEVVKDMCDNWTVSFCNVFGHGWVFIF